MSDWFFIISLEMLDSTIWALPLYILNYCIPQSFHFLLYTLPTRSTFDPSIDFAVFLRILEFNSQHQYNYRKKLLSSYDISFPLKAHYLHLCTSDYFDTCNPSVSSPTASYSWVLSNECQNIVIDIHWRAFLAWILI